MVVGLGGASRLEQEFGFSLGKIETDGYYGLISSIGTLTPEDATAVADGLLTCKYGGVAFMTTHLGRSARDVNCAADQTDRVKLRDFVASQFLGSWDFELLEPEFYDALKACVSE